MALLKIELLGSQVLREKAEAVETVTDQIRSLVRDMFDTMYHAEGIGLAAPQIGVSKRITVLDVPGDDDDTRHVHVLINPVIVEVSPDTEKGIEGCLSIPGIEESVVRPARVALKALSPDGGEVRVDAEGLLARALQHEMDHLNGVLFIDHLTGLKRELALRKWQRTKTTAAGDL